MIVKTSTINKNKSTKDLRMIVRTEEEFATLLINEIKRLTMSYAESKVLGSKEATEILSNFPKYSKKFKSQAMKNISEKYRLLNSRVKNISLASFEIQEKYSELSKQAELITWSAGDKKYQAVLTSKVIK